MNSKLFMLFFSSAVSIGLISTSIYLVIEHLIAPSDMLFEAAVLFSIGTLLGLMVTIALSIGQTIMIFGEILQQQVQIQKQMRDMSNVAQGSFHSFLSNIIPPGVSDVKISMKDFELLDEELQGKMGEILKTQEFGDMNLEELEKELAKAIVDDNFELAEKLNKAIKLLGESGESGELEEKD